MCICVCTRIHVYEHIHVHIVYVHVCVYIVYVHVCLCTCACTRVYVCMCIYTCVHVHLCLSHVHVHVYMYIHVCIYVGTCVYVYLCIYMCACVICLHVHMYVRPTYVCVSDPGPCTAYTNMPPWNCVLSPQDTRFVKEGDFDTVARLLAPRKAWYAGCSLFQPLWGDNKWGGKLRPANSNLPSVRMGCLSLQWSHDPKLQPLEKLNCLVSTPDSASWSHHKCRGKAPSFSIPCHTATAANTQLNRNESLITKAIWACDRAQHVKTLAARAWLLSQRWKKKANSRVSSSTCSDLHVCVLAWPPTTSFAYMHKTVKRVLKNTAIYSSAVLSQC